MDHYIEKIQRLTAEVEALRKETALQEATIEALEAENEKLQSMLLAWRASARVDA